MTRPGKDWPHYIRTRTWANLNRNARGWFRMIRMTQPSRPESSGVSLPPSHRLLVAEKKNISYRTDGRCGSGAAVGWRRAYGYRDTYGRQLRYIRRTCERWENPRFSVFSNKWGLWECRVFHIQPHLSIQPLKISKWKKTYLCCEKIRLATIKVEEKLRKYLDFNSNHAWFIARGFDPTIVDSSWFLRSSIQPHDEQILGNV